MKDAGIRPGRISFGIAMVIAVGVLIPAGAYLWLNWSGQRQSNGKSRPIPVVVAKKPLPQANPRPSEPMAEIPMPVFADGEPPSEKPAQPKKPLAIELPGLEPKGEQPAITPEPEPSKIALNDQTTDTPTPNSFRRIRVTTERELYSQLLKTPELALDSVPQSSTLLFRAAQLPQNRDVDLAPTLIAQRRDLGGLPVRKGADCRLANEPARNLQTLSRLLRSHLQASIPGIGNSGVLTTRNNALAPPDAAILRQRLLDSKERDQWLRPEAIPVLMQMLMASPTPIRRLLVELLEQIPGRQSSQALVQRALYELEPEVRRSAVDALGRRPPAEFQDQLIPAFQHPWPPIADHAAECIGHLKLKDLAPKLIVLFEMKNPMIPMQAEGPQKMVTELVRVNHLGNCLMCHAASTSTNDLVRGVIPLPGQPLPAPATSPSYYEALRGSFVRADVTYLKQDFSLQIPVANPGVWPAEQRFDFLLRRRPVGDLETTAILVEKNPKLRDAFPQKEALNFAIKILMKDEPAKFEQMIAKGEEKNESQKLVRDLASAPLVLQEGLLEKVAQEPGDPATDALAQAIPQLPETLWKRGRTLLAQRLAKSSPTDLQRRLTEKDPEIRRAAIVAAGTRKDSSLVSSLVELLNERDPEVLWSLRMALLALADQDFGPPLHADAQQSRQAQDQWRAWMKTRTP